MKALRTLIALLPSLGWANQPGLIAHSHLIAKPKGWMQIQLDVPRYAWLSSHQILFWKDSLEDHGLCVYDVPTGRSRDLTKLSHLATQYRFESFFDLSPNGKWLLFGGWIQDSPLWFACHIDGSGLISWKRHDAPRSMSGVWPESVAHWSSKGDFLTEAEPIESKRGPLTQVWLRPFPSVSKETKCPVLATNMGFAYVDAQEVGGKQLVCVNQQSDPSISQPVDIYSWIAEKPSSLRHFQMKIPMNTIVEYQFSPDRKRLLWEFRQGLMTPDDILPKGSKSLSLWVSDLKGRHLKMLGEIQVKDNWKSDEDQDFGELHWLPDSKTASFIYFGKLYEVAVP